MSSDPSVTVNPDEIRKLIQRVKFLEDLLKCPRCRGIGSVGHGLNQDECPECHGFKWRFAE